MSTTVKPLYGTATAMTITLASLGASATLGQGSLAVDNTTDLADDAVVVVKTTTGTSPTVGTLISIYAYGSTDGSIYSGGLLGTNSTGTPSPVTGLKLLDTITVTATSNQAYTGGPYSIANAMGGTMPRKWGLWILNNTGVALNATAGNHNVSYTPVQYQNI